MGTELKRAQNQVEEWRQKTVWRRSHGKPFRMQDVQLDALLATWEIITSVVDKKPLSKGRIAELRTIHRQLETTVSDMKDLPVLVRSLDHRVGLEHAEWAVEVLACALRLV